MSVVDDIAVPGAHGAGMAPDGKAFYVTNLPNGGEGGLVTIPLTGKNKNTVLGTTDTPFVVPHNIAVTSTSEFVYITHSGPTNDKLSKYAVSGRGSLPTLEAEITVGGTNPFGLDFVP